MLQDTTQFDVETEDDEDLDELYEDFGPRVPLTPEDHMMHNLAEVISDGVIFWVFHDEEVVDRDVAFEVSLETFPLAQYLLEAMECTIEEIVSDEECVVRLRIPADVTSFLKGDFLSDLTS